MAAGLNPMDLKRGMDTATDAIISELQKNSKIVKSDKEVQMIREQRAAQQQQQMQMMQAMQEAKVAKDAAPIVKELNNVGQ